MLSKKYIGGIALVAILGAAVGFLSMGQGAFSKTIFHDDSTTIAYWAFPFANGDTYHTGDLAAHMKRNFADPIPQIAYAIFAPFLDPLWMPKVFAALSTALTFVFALLFGFRLLQLPDASKGMRSAVAVAFVAACWAEMWNRAMPYAGVGNGGDFLVPLILAALWAADKKSPVGIAVTLFFAAGTYPSAFLICGGICFLAMFDRTSGSGFINKKILVALALAAISVLLLRGGSILLGPDPLIGSLRTAGDMINDPSFHANGRHPLWLGNWALSFFLGAQGGLAGRPQLFAIMLVAVILLVARLGRVGPLNKTAWSLLIVSAIGYALAWILLAKLFYPSRFVRATVPIFLWCMILSGLARWIIEEKVRRTQIIKSVFAVALTLMLISGSFKNYAYTQVNQSRMPLYETIRKLPKQTMIAGHPWKIDAVPYLGQRSVLVSFESLMPVFDRYHESMSKRINDTFAALFADDPADVLRFCKKYSVTHLLIPTEMYDFNKETRRPIFIEPYGSAANVHAQDNYDRWVLNKSQFSGQIYNDKQTILVPCSAEALFGSFE